MIRLVQRLSSDAYDRTDGETTPSGIAGLMRSALGADAAVVAEISADGARRVIGSDGLSGIEADAAMTRLAAPQPNSMGEMFGPRGFSRMIYDQAGEVGVDAAAVCVLLRQASNFSNTDLLPVFARHAAASVGLRRPGGHVEPTGPAGTIEPRGIDAFFDLSDLEQGDYEDFNRALATEFQAGTGARLVGVLMWDEQDALLRPLPGSFGADPEETPPAHDVDDWNSSAARVFATGEPYLTNRAERDPGVLADYVGAFGFDRLLTVPLNIGSRRIGVLQLANKPDDFGLPDVRFTYARRTHVAMAAQMVRMRDRLVRRRQLEGILGRVAVHIASGRNLQDFLGAAMDDVCAAVAGSMVALIPRAGDPLIRRRGPDRGALEGVVLRQGGEANSMRVFAAGARRAGTPGWTAAHVPVVLETDCVATVSALRCGGDAFDETECDALSRLAQLVALAWSTERYQRQLADAARVAECQRIADELHDHVAQLLFAARLSLDFAQEVPGLPDTAEASIKRGRELLLRADTATRRVMEENSQHAEDHLPGRLAALVGSVEEEFARPVALDIAPLAAAAAGTLSRSATNLVARAAREALVNAAKHAGPCQIAVSVTVTRRNRLLLTVTDGGIGVGSRHGNGYGTRALRRTVRRHGGVLRVSAVATGGTNVALSLPL
jgi:signal transduction histidine kinase